MSHQPSYHPQKYWENRLSRSLNLEGVGCLGKGIRLNTYLYRAKARAMERGLGKIGLKDLQGKSLLDLGSGIGFWIDYFLKRGVADCVGVDITEVAVTYLSTTFPKDRTTFLHADISALEFSEILKGKQFDIVTAMDVLYHIVDDRCIQQAVKNIGLLVKEGGLLIFTDVLFSPPQYPQQPHVKWRPKRLWENLLTPLGFEIEALMPLYVFLRSAVTGPRILKHFINLISYGITYKISEKQLWGEIYLRILSSFDDLCIRVTGKSTSTYMIFARRI